MQLGYLLNYFDGIVDEKVRRVVQLKIFENIPTCQPVFHRSSTVTILNFADFERAPGEVCTPGEKKENEKLKKNAPLLTKLPFLTR